MNSKQANRLLKLAQFLEQLEEQKWNFSSFESLSELNVCRKVDKSKDEAAGDINSITCGTTACALGWCTVVFPNKFKSGLMEDINKAIQEQDIDTLKGLLKEDNFALKTHFEGRWISNYGLLDEDHKLHDDFNGDAFSASVGEFFGLSEAEVTSTFLNHVGYKVSRLEDVTKKMVINKIYRLLDEHGYKVV